KGVPGHLVQQAGIIYGASLPEKKAYEELGYRSFFQRSDAVTALLERAKEHGKPLSLVFINTIQHNERNYHDP
ncbi:MAG: hypothetical protein GTO40_00780, partial [Deltaproteobacteria bacterium]|nr:hypothetical protein [Deltaproteobacteria bacterium]